MRPRGRRFTFALMGVVFIVCAGLAATYGLAAEVAFGLGAAFGVVSLGFALGIDRSDEHT